MLVELGVKRLVVAKGNVGNGEIEELVGQLGLLERLVADVRVGIKRLGDLRRQRINLNADDGGMGQDCLRHESDEMPDTTGGFQNASLFESETFERGVHPLDDGTRRVMSVEGGGAGGAKFILGQKRGEFDIFRLPIGGRTENLRQTAPTDITDQRGLFLVGRIPVFGLKFAKQPDGGKISPALFLERTLAHPVGLGDAVIILIADYAVSSGVNKMYSSRTISQAWSCACCAVNPCAIKRVVRSYISSFVFSSASSNASSSLPWASSSFTICGRNSRHCFSAIKPYCVRVIMVSCIRKEV